MSNATEPSRKTGDQRRRRSRGGKNRNRNNQQRHQGEHHQGESSHSGPPRQRRERRSSPPVKLTLWQKLLKAIGLYKAPEKPKPRKQFEADSPAPKSNTRVATSVASAAAPSRKESPKKGGKRSRGGDPSTVESARVYVGNLSYDVTEHDLEELFKGVGTVRRTEIVYNRNTHRSKGYGFVEMIHKDDAIRAVEVLHEQPFMGRNMIVSGASSRPQEIDDEEESGPEIKAADIPLAPLPVAAPPAEAEEVETPSAEAGASDEAEPAAEEPKPGTVAQS